MSVSESSAVDPAELAELLAIPYVAVFYSVELADGEWVRRGEYPELPGCVAEARDTADAMDLLERRKRELIAGALARGEPVPRPRPPLRSGACAMDSRTAQALAADLRGVIRRT